MEDWRHDPKWLEAYPEFASRPEAVKLLNTNPGVWTGTNKQIITLQNVAKIPDYKIMNRMIKLAYDHNVGPWLRSVEPYCPSDHVGFNQLVAAFENMARNLSYERWVEERLLQLFAKGIRDTIGFTEHDVITNRIYKRVVRDLTKVATEGGLD